MPGIPWTQKEKTILAQLARKGYTAREIQKVLKSRSLDAIHCQADNLAISISGPMPEIDFEEFRRLLKHSTPN